MTDLIKTLRIGNRKFLKDNSIVLKNEVKILYVSSDIYDQLEKLIEESDDPLGYDFLKYMGKMLFRCFLVKKLDEFVPADYFKFALERNRVNN